MISACCGREDDDSLLVLVLLTNKSLPLVLATNGTDNRVSKALAAAEAILSPRFVNFSLSSNSGIISTDTATAFRAAVTTLDKPSRNEALVITSRLGGVKMHNRLKKYGKILVYSDSEQSNMHRRSNVESTKLSVDADAIYGYK